MKNPMLIILALLMAGVPALAQNRAGAGPQEDSAYAGRGAVDSSQAGMNIFQILGGSQKRSGREGRVVIDQSQAVADALLRHIADNAHRMQSGYRIRIYFDNSQNARVKSEKIASGFKAQHPGINVYREYENPYFKVTVGDFRNKQDAQRFLNTIKGTYPSGFIVREKINFPVM